MVTPKATATMTAVHAAGCETPFGRVAPICSRSSLGTSELAGFGFTGWASSGDGAGMV